MFMIKSKQSTEKLFMFLLAIAALSSFLGGCNQESNGSELSDSKYDDEYLTEDIAQKGIKNSVPEGYHVSSTSLGPVAAYSPLTLTKFNDVLNDQDPFSQILIISSVLACDGGFDDPYIITEILLQNEYQSAQYYSDVETFLCSYNKYDTIPDPPESTSAEHIFLRDHIAQHIFSYLILHSDYFFNNDEFTGLSIPYESMSGGVSDLPEEDFVFLLSIYEPDSNFNAWAIDKSMDESNPTLNGLMDIIEQHYFSIFE